MSIDRWMDKEDEIHIYSGNFAYKTVSPQTIREFRGFEHRPPVFLAWRCNKPFPGPDSSVSVYLASLCIKRTNLCSVTTSAGLQSSEGSAGAGGDLLPKSLMLLWAQFLTIWASRERFWRHPRTWQLAFPKANDLRKRTKRKPHCLSWSNLANRIPFYRAQWHGGAVLYKSANTRKRRSW